MKIFILVFLFTFSFLTVYSQPFGNLTNSLSVLKTQSRDNSALISAKIGYHTENEKTLSHGFDGGMIYSLSFDGSLSSEVGVGVSFDFWHHTNEEYKYSDGKIAPQINSGTNINFNLLRRFQGRYNSFNMGIGIGFNMLQGNESSHDSYFNMKLIISDDIRFFSDDVFLSPQVEYNYMISGERTAGIFCFKLGPSFKF